MAEVEAVFGIDEETTTAETGIEGWTNMAEVSDRRRITVGSAPATDVGRDAQKRRQQWCDSRQ